MKTVGNKTVDKFGLQKELRSKPVPLDQKLEVLWNHELPVEDENFISRVVTNLPSGMAPEEERELESTFLKEKEIPIPVVSEVADYDAARWIQPTEYCQAPVEEYDLLPYDLDEVDEEWLRGQQHSGDPCATAPVDDLLLEICLNFFELHSPSKGAELEEEGLVEKISNVYRKIRPGKTTDLASVQKVYSYWKAKGGAIKPIVPVLVDPRKLRAKSKRRRVTGKDTKMDWNTVFVEEGINSELESAILVKRREMVNTAIVKLRRDLFDIDGAEHEIRLAERKKRKRDRHSHSHSHRERDRDRDNSASESSHHKKRKLHRRDSSGREHRHHSSYGAAPTAALSARDTTGAHSASASTQHVSKETKRAAELESELSQLMASVGYNTRKKKTNYLFYDDDDEPDYKKEKAPHKSRLERRHEAIDYESDFIDVLGEDTSIFLSEESSVDSMEVVDNFYSFDESIESSEDDSFGEEDLLPYSEPAYFKYCGGPVVCVDTTKRKILITTRRISRCGRDILNYSLLDYGEYAHILSNDFLTHYSKDASSPWSDQFKLKIANPVPPAKPRNRSQPAKPRRRLYQQIPPVNPQQQTNPANGGVMMNQPPNSSSGGGVASNQSNQVTGNNQHSQSHPPQQLPHKPRPRSPKKLFPREPIFLHSGNGGGNPAHAKQRHHAPKLGPNTNAFPGGGGPHVPNNNNNNGNASLAMSANSSGGAMGSVSLIPEAAGLNAGRSPLVKSADSLGNFDAVSSHVRLVAKHPRASVASNANHVINLVDGEGQHVSNNKQKDVQQGRSLSMQGIQQHNAMQLLHQKSLAKANQGGLSFQHQPIGGGGGGSGLAQQQPSGHSIQFLHHLKAKSMDNQLAMSNPNIPPDILPPRDRSNIDFGAVKPNEFHNQEHSGKIPNIHLSNANRMAGNNSNNQSRMSNNNPANMNFSFNVNTNSSFPVSSKFTDMSQTNGSRPLNNENFLKNTIHNHIIKNQKGHQSFNLHSSPQKQQHAPGINLSARASLHHPPLHIKNQSPGSQFASVPSIAPPTTASHSNAQFAQQISKTQGLSHSPIGTVAMHQNTALNNNNNSCSNLMTSHNKQIHSNANPSFVQFSAPSHPPSNSFSANEKMSLSNPSAANVLPTVLPLSKATAMNGLGVSLGGNAGMSNSNNSNNSNSMGNVNFSPMTNANLNMASSGMGKNPSAPTLSSQTSSFMLSTAHQQPQPPPKHVPIYSQSHLAQHESLFQQHQLAMSQQQQPNQRGPNLPNQSDHQNMMPMTNQSMRSNQRPQQQQSQPPGGVSSYSMLPGSQGMSSHAPMQPLANAGQPNQQNSLMHNEHVRLQQIVQQQKMQLQQQGQLANPMLGMKPPQRDQQVPFSHQSMSGGDARGHQVGADDGESGRQYMQSMPPMQSNAVAQHSSLHPSAVQQQQSFAPTQQRMTSPEPFGTFHAQSAQSFPMQQQSLPHQLPNLMSIGMGQSATNNQPISFHNFS